MSHRMGQTNISSEASAERFGRRRNELHLLLKQGCSSMYEVEASFACTPAVPPALREGGGEGKKRCLSFSTFYQKL